MYGDNINLFICNSDIHAMEFKFVFKFFIDGMCVVALTFATKTMSGATFYFIVVMLLTSGWYFVISYQLFFATNYSLQYVGFIICMVSYGARVFGDGWL